MPKDRIFTTDQPERISSAAITGGVMKSFLFGLGIGIGLGVLFAPMSGEETRNTLSERANDLASSARETFEQGRERVISGVNAMRGAAEREIRPTGTEGSNL